MPIDGFDPSTIPKMQADRDRAIGRMLRELFGQDTDSDGFLTISRDGETGYVTLQFIGSFGTRLQAYRADIFAALQVMLQREPYKRCPHCRKQLPHWAFASDVNTLDGRVRRCRECERSRVKLYDRKQRRRAKRGESPQKPKNGPGRQGR